MIEHLEKWIYVNDVKNKKLVEIAYKIEKENIEPIIFTRKWEILYYFWKLINGKIKLEDFYMFNDTFFNKKTYKYKLSNWVDAIDYVKNNHKKNKIYVIDDLFQTDIDLENVYFL